MVIKENNLSKRNITSKNQFLHARYFQIQLDNNRPNVLPQTVKAVNINCGNTERLGSQYQFPLEKTKHPQVHKLAYLLAHFIYLPTSPKNPIRRKWNLNPITHQNTQPITPPPTPKNGDFSRVAQESSANLNEFAK